MQHITVFGDSIGRGVIFDEERKRYAVAKTNYASLLEQRGVLKIDNHARFGASVEDGLADFTAAQGIQTRVVALLYGGNDCNLKWDEVARQPEAPHSAKVPLQEFKQKLEQLVTLVQQRGHIPLLITPPPLIASRFFHWVSQGLDGEKIRRFVGDIHNIYHWQERYAGAVHQVAQTTSTPLFDLRDAFLARNNMTEYYCVDGMHPNDKGQALIADAIENAVPDFQNMLRSAYGD